MHAATGDMAEIPELLIAHSAFLRDLVGSDCDEDGDERKGGGATLDDIPFPVPLPELMAYVDDAAEDPVTTERPIVWTREFLRAALQLQLEPPIQRETEFYLRMHACEGKAKLAVQLKACPAHVLPWFDLRVRKVKALCGVPWATRGQCRWQDYEDLARHGRTFLAACVMGAVPAEFFLNNLSTQRTLMEQACCHPRTAAKVVELLRLKPNPRTAAKVVELLRLKPITTAVAAIAHHIDLQEAWKWVPEACADARHIIFARLAEASALSAFQHWMSQLEPVASAAVEMACESRPALAKEVQDFATTIARQGCAQGEVGFSRKPRLRVSQEMCQVLIHVGHLRLSQAILERLTQGGGCGATIDQLLCGRHADPSLRMQPSQWARLPRMYICRANKPAWSLSTIRAILRLADSALTASGDAADTQHWQEQWLALACTQVALAPVKQALAKGYPATLLAVTAACLWYRHKHLELLLAQPEAADRFGQAAADGVWTMAMSRKDAKAVRLEAACEARGSKWWRAHSSY